MRFWKRYVQYYLNHFSSPDIHKEEGLPSLRDKLFISVLLLAFPICLLVYVPSLFVSLKTEQHIIGICDSLAILVVTLIFIIKNQSIISKKIIFAANFYFLSIVLLIYLGIKGPSIVILICISVLLTLFQGRRAGLISVALNGIILLLFMALLPIKSINLTFFEEYSVVTWIGIGLNLIAFNAITVLAVASLVSHLNESFLKEKELQLRLKMESFDLLTAKKIAEESDLKYKMIFEASGTSNSIFDREYCLLLQNSVAKKERNKQIDDAIGLSVYELFGEVTGGQIAKKMDRVFRTNASEVEEIQIQTSSGTNWYRSSYQPVMDENENVIAIQIISQDITDMKRSEIELYKSSRLYAVISQVNKAIVHLKVKDLLFDEVCNIAVKFGEFRMAWIGLIDENEQVIKPVTYAGFEEGYLSTIRQISVSNSPEGRGPTGKAIREGKHFVCSDFENDPNVNIWKNDALKRGYHSSIALPIRLFGKVIGTFTLYASIPNFFDQEEIELLTEVADDISFALENLELEENHRNASILLMKSEEQFHSIFSNLQDAYFQANLTGKFTMISPSAVRIYGYDSIEEMMDIPVVNLYANPRERENMIDKLREKGAVVDLNCEGKKKDGTTFWVSMNIQFQYQNNQISGTEGVVRDITHRKIQEDKIRTLSSAIEQSPVSVVITDTNGNIEYVNPKFSQITGYSSDEAINKNPRILKSNTKTTDEYKQLWETITSGQEWHGEFLNIKKNGESYYETASISPVFSENGQIAHYIAVKEDITSRKKDEKQIKTLSTALEQSPSMIVITNKIGKIEYINTKFKVFLQYTTAEILGKYPRIFNPKHHTKESYHKMWETLQAGLVWQSEFRNRKKDLTEFWENVTISPLIGPDGLTSNYIIINEDITDKKQMISDLIEAKEKAEESDRLKSAFLANMSHEIRTPMNGILGFAGLLEDPGLSGDEQREYIDIIEKSGARMLNIINEIVDISRIESGLIEVTNSETNIDEQIEDVYDLLYLDAESKGIKLSFINSSPEPKTLIKTDRVKLYAILINLVKNAIKYTDKGSVEFGYTVETMHASSLQFYVKDTGIGIPVNRQKAIFERFIQADILDVQARQGAGLGLSIAKAYVEILGGQIWVDSEYGNGATFYFTIPFEVKPEETNGTKNIYSTVYDGNCTKSEDSGLKILIVEDDEASEKYLTTIISIISNTILYASTGNGAVEICRNNPDIDLVLMDIRMPGMNGYEATHQIRQFNKDVIIIAQTAFGLISDREKSLEAGCNDYISKPIKKDDLLALIHSYIS